MAREPASTPYEAEQRFTRIISRGLTCISESFWVASTPLRGNPKEDRVLSLAGGTAFGIRLRRPDESAVFLKATHAFRLQPDTRFVPSGEWKAHTTEYIYTVYEQTDEHAIKPSIAWHYHPSSPVMGDPHIHVYGDGMACQRHLDKLHIPSERVAFEMVVRFLVDDIGVLPNRDDWRELVDESLASFVKFRTWPYSTPLGPESEP